MSVRRRSEVQITELNLYDPDDSAQMFYGGYVKTFTANGKDISFIYRKIDPGTLLELVDIAMTAPKTDQETGEDKAEPLTPMEQLQQMKVDMVHRLEVLQKCIVQPAFKNLDQIKSIPMEWQIELYKLIMHGVLAGGATESVARFPEEDEGERAS